jgi:hypothetical protein
MSSTYPNERKDQQKRMKLAWILKGIKADAEGEQRREQKTRKT